MTTSNMSLNEPSVGVTTGPTWATETNANWELLDAHDHTSGKGVQLTPSALNINADMEFNQNSATELKNAVLDNDIHASASGDTNYSVYSYGANLYWRNGSGTAVQITNGASLNSTGGAITSPTTDSQVLFSSAGNSYTFKYDKTQTDGIAKMIHSDLQLYFYNSGSETTRSVNLKYLGSGTGSNTLTVPDETGTLLSTATSFAGAINIATSSTNYPINLKPNGTGHVVIGNAGATGKLTSNGAYDLILDTNSGTNSSSIAITDAANGNISFIPNGTGEIVIGSGSASGKITSSGAFDLVLDTNAGTNSGTITITDGANGEITIDTHGTGDINLTAGADINIPADIGLVFGDDGEKIEGDGTNLTINSSALLNLSAANDVVIPVDVGLVFGDGGEKIESDNTDLTITSGVAINLNAGVLDLSAQTVDVTLNAAVDALNFDSNTLSIDASNNRVGIGIAAPTDLLHVYGGASGQTADPYINLVIEDDDHCGLSFLTPADKAGLIYFGRAGDPNVGRINYDHGVDALYIYTNNAEQFRITSTGNIGIGNDNPGSLLEIGKVTTSNTALTIASQENAGNESGYIYFRDAASTTAMQIRAHHGENRLKFGVASFTSALTIDGANGFIGINRTNPTQLLHIENAGNSWTSKVGNTAGSGTVLMNYWVTEDHAPNDTTSKYVHAQDSSANRFIVYSDGSVWTSADGTLSSDERLKQNIVDATPKLDDLMRLKVRNFEWKNDYNPNKEGKKLIGLIAQEVEEIFPGLISEQDIAPEPKKVFDEDGQDITPEHKPVFRKSIKQAFTPMIIKAIQELSAKVTALENA
jgi:hypothetical protein